MQRTSVTLMCSLLVFLAASCSKPPERLQVDKLVAQVFPEWQRETLELPDRFEFLTLSPMIEADKRKVIGKLHSFDILGRAEVTDRDLQRTLIEELYRAIVSKADAKPMKCFDPRHAIHAEKNGKSLDVLVCFSCDYLQAFPSDNKYQVAIPTGGLVTWKEMPGKLDLPEEHFRKAN